MPLPRAAFTCSALGRRNAVLALFCLGQHDARVAAPDNFTGPNESVKMRRVLGLLVMSGKSARYPLLPLVTNSGHPHKHEGGGAQGDAGAHQVDAGRATHRGSEQEGLGEQQGGGQSGWQGPRPMGALGRPEPDRQPAREHRVGQSAQCGGPGAREPGGGESQQESLYRVAWGQGVRQGRVDESGAARRGANPNPSASPNPSPNPCPCPRSNASSESDPNAHSSPHPHPRQVEGEIHALEASLTEAREEAAAQREAGSTWQKEAEAARLTAEQVRRSSSLPTLSLTRAGATARARARARARAARARAPNPDSHPPSSQPSSGAAHGGARPEPEP